MAGKPPVITLVVDSMTENLRPTRAEATDVASSILDASYTSESIILLLIAVLIPHSSSWVQRLARTVSCWENLCREFCIHIFDEVFGFYCLTNFLLPFEHPYMEVASSYSSGKVSELEKYIQTNREMFESIEDGEIYATINQKDGMEKSLVDVTNQIDQPKASVTMKQGEEKSLVDVTNQIDQLKASVTTKQGEVRIKLIDH
ncbi:hypothetical protein NC651_026862 [Populus alba x Populus x berolinensis]|nr:hypothetical protein NC651_026862 [Populus alba x Populus x berolinensis]